MPENAVHIRFDGGTIVVDAPADTTLPLPLSFVYDKRIGAWRAEAVQYASLILALHQKDIPYVDEARRYNSLPLQSRESGPPRTYQTEAINAWVAAGRRGVIVLPTGTGKSFVARMAMTNARRSTLVVVPTIDLMEQWASQLEKAFDQPIGMLGGGSHDVRDITVSTYDSAILSMESIGNRFGLLIVDECHHLPGPSYKLLALFAIAPFRLGLTATPDGRDKEPMEFGPLLGDVCYQKDITELSGKALAPYRTVRIPSPLTMQEQLAYETARGRYVNFLRSCHIDLAMPDGWKEFLFACARRPGGRDALNAYYEQRRISRSCQSKMSTIWQLLSQHCQERVLIFTADNRTAYDIGQRFCLPVITHHTKTPERHALLEAFRHGDLPFLVTSKVLNEGVDVPEASVGIVVSGSGSVREHVQRLGRILRPGQGKEAILYELVSLGTGELNVSERRRQHSAYEGLDNL